MSNKGVGDYFDGMAHEYDSYIEEVRWAGHLLLGKTLVELESDPQTILDLGAGTGYSLSEVLKHTTPESVTAVDASEGMLQQLAAKYPNDQRITLVHDDIEAYLSKTTPKQSFDLITSMAVLQFQSPSKLTRIIGRVAQHLNPQGQFMFTFDPQVEADKIQSRRRMASRDHAPQYRVHPDKILESISLSGLKQTRFRLNRPRPGDPFVGAFVVAELP